jgi:hypothetical protein
MIAVFGREKGGGEWSKRSRTKTAQGYGGRHS